MSIPAWLTVKVAGYIALALVLLGLAGWWANTVRKARQFDNVKGQVQTMQFGAEVAQDTSDRVSREAWEVMRQAAEDEGAIRERINMQHRASGPADPDILRIATEAHGRAAGAAGRVSGAVTGDASAKPAKQ